MPIRVRRTAPAEKGKANKAIIKVLEKSLELAKGSVRISSGTTASRKVIEIKCDNKTVTNKKLEDIHNN